MSPADTIFALATPPGKSGVAVVRLSGPQATQALTALRVPLPAPRQATLASLMGAGGFLDKALVLYFPGPHSFTGEDTVEFHIHGSRAVLKALLSELSGLAGFRPAEAGEFTRRAFFAGKMDLTAAEGLADLIDAETEAQRKQAARFLQGDAATFYGGLRTEILEALALTEAYIDFPDEEIPPQVLEQTYSKTQAIRTAIQAQLQDNRVAERIRDGLHLAIIGPPNAGKSSLMNLLARRDVAIVSETAGTTRDVIEVHMDIGGYAVVVADTAGIREAQDAIEREGIRRSLARAEAADIRLLVLDAGNMPPKEELDSLISGQVIVLINKTDRYPLPRLTLDCPVIGFSTLSGEGMESLMQELLRRLEAFAGSESSFIARSRHRHHLTQAQDHLEAYQASGDKGLELACEELRRAALEIGSITGAVTPDEVLGFIFSRFCIGK